MDQQWKAREYSIVTLPTNFQFEKNINSLEINVRCERWTSKLSGYPDGDTNSQIGEGKKAFITILHRFSFIKTTSFVSEKCVSQTSWASFNLSKTIIIQSDMTKNYSIRKHHKRIG